MVSRGTGDDGGLSELPWASVFDPSVNVRALGEIQARGFHAASELVDRFVKVASAEASPKPAVDEPGAEVPKVETSGGAAAPDVDRLLGSWRAMVGQLVGSIRASTSDTAQGEAAAFDLAAERASGEIALFATEPGATSAEVWLHNAGALDLGKVTLRCTELMSHDGSVIASSMVRFEPDTVPMPARCSRGITVEVDVADDVTPGIYHGTLLGEGHPKVWMPVSLTVLSQVP